MAENELITRLARQGRGSTSEDLTASGNTQRHVEALRKSPSGASESLSRLVASVGWATVILALIVGMTTGAGHDSRE